MTNRHSILPLDPQIVGKIAAGEVVERPALAIKELIENSIDSGATSISIQIREGGLSYFRVTDNGSGIDPADIKMAFSRHATSKIKSEKDLYSIYTLGFRGEALHSIAAVSKVEMISRRTGRSHGVKAVVEGGVFQSIQDAPSPEGTSIIVRDLFFNTPVRKKFVKKPITEASLIADMVMRLIIARPDISFRLQNEEKKVYYSPGNGKLRDALLTIWGHEALTGFKEVSGSAAGCAVEGFVGVGELSKSNRSMQTFILNGRFVRNSFLSQALEEGCRESVMVGKHPVCALHLTMPFEAVDVNVHPNKLEVRFSDERALRYGIASIIDSALKADPMQSPSALPIDKASKKKDAPEALPARMPIASVPVSYSFETDRPAVKLSDSANAVRFRADQLSAFVPPQESQPVAPVPHPQEKEAESFRVIGAAFQAYILVEMGETLYFVDQHAAHERILYERFQKTIDTENLFQVLLTPHIVQLTHREHAAVLSSIEDLSACGFDIEDFGDRSIQVRAVPMVLGVAQTKDFLRELAERVSEYKTLPTADQKRDALIQMACKKAVKAGDPLPIESIEDLIRQMRETGAFPTCPHGRPLVIRIEKADLDKRFRRT